MGFETIFSLGHCDTVPVNGVPLFSPRDFRRNVIDAANAGGRISSFFGMPVDGGVRLYAVLTFSENSSVAILASDVDDTYPSVTPDCPQAHWFEREIAEQWGVLPEGHPWLKPIRFHKSYRPGNDAWGRPDDSDILPSVTNFFRVEGEEVHEVAVGPVHAGVIEPGHFRFQCHGEGVFSLEISLGYQHRGIERALVGGPDRKTVHFMETLAGDTTVAHAAAYAQAVEALSGCIIPARAESLRAIALELERMANHTGDLGALSMDVGFLPTASFCGRLRGDFLNMTAAICGNRFGRGLVRPGGTGYDIDGQGISALRTKLDAAFRDVTGAVDLLFKTPSVLARFENTGTVSTGVCLALGLVGPASRACGVSCDTRRNFPMGAYRREAVEVSTCETGDVLARANIRWLELKNSYAYIKKLLADIADGPVSVPVDKLPPDSITVSLSEGWRGEVCHVGITGADGRFAHYKVVDPSFHNWAGLQMALRGQQISDFPLCNKSFNLSYCGHDL